MRTEEEILEVYNKYDFMAWSDFRNLTEYGMGFYQALRFVLDEKTPVKLGESEVAND